MTPYQIDTSHSQIEFAVRHLVISKVRGRFGRFQGEVLFDEADPTRSSVKVTIDASSIDTNEAKRDAHLRSPDFFDVEKHPELLFASRTVERAGEGRYRVVGDLTMRGITREIVLEVEDHGRVRDPWGGNRVAFSARASLDRRDYQLEWNAVLETGGFVVGDKIEITLEVEGVQASAVAAA